MIRTGTTFELKRQQNNGLSAIGMGRKSMLLPSYVDHHYPDDGVAEILRTKVYLVDLTRTDLHPYPDGLVERLCTLFGTDVNHIKFFYCSNVTRESRAWSSLLNGPEAVQEQHVTKWNDVDVTMQVDHNPLVLAAKVYCRHGTKIMSRIFYATE